MLSTPPAFILSQDQTLVKNVCIRVRIAWQFCSCLLFWFDIFRCPFLKNLFKEFSGFVVYCSVINVLFVVAVSCDSFYIISKRFMFVNNFFKLFFVAFLNLSNSNSDILSYIFLLVNNFFEVFSKVIFKQNGERGIRTLAPVARPTPLAGAPLRPLEYFSSARSKVCI